VFAYMYLGVAALPKQGPNAGQPGQGRGRPQNAPGACEDSTAEAALVDKEANEGDWWLLSVQPALIIIARYV